MMRKPPGTTLVALVAVLCLSMAGCLPKRVTCWSRDGQHAIIVTDTHKAYLAGPDGKLSQPLDDVVGRVAWFADSKRFAMTRIVEIANWEQSKEFLSKEQQDKVLALEKAVRQEVLAHEGSWDGWKPAAASNLTDSELMALWMHIRQYNAKGLPEKLGDKWKEYAELKMPFGVIQLGEVQSGRLVPGKTVIRLTEMAGSLRVSPDGTKIAYMVSNPELEAARNKNQPKPTPVSSPEPVPANPSEPSPISSSQPTPAEDTTTQPSGGLPNAFAFPLPAGGILMVVDANGRSKPFQVARIAAWNPEFSADSQWLVYAATQSVPADDDSLVLGSIERRRILDGPDGLHLENPEALAGVVHYPFTTIVCTKDGDILFSSLAITLPAAGNFPNAPTLSLFSLAPGRRATVATMLTDAARTSVPSDGFQFGTFDVRPDGGAVTFHDDKGTIGYYVFATDKVEYIIKEPKDVDVKILDQPSWRNNEELSFVVGPGHEWGSPKRPEMILYSITTKQARCISRNWPDELMNSFGDKSPTSQPASEPAPYPATQPG